jgi:hypothetical protein
MHGKPKGKGSVSVIDFATRQGAWQTWPVPGGGSPDMGGVSRRRQAPVAVGPLRRRGLPLRHHERRGRRSFAVGKQPHGLAVWPQPGRYNAGAYRQPALR